MKGQFAALYCDRRFGIGADGVLFLSKPTKKADVRMRVFQPDESEAGDVRERDPVSCEVCVR